MYHYYYRPDLLLYLTFEKDLCMMKLESKNMTEFLAVGKACKAIL